jgi:hypothetical protein
MNGSLSDWGMRQNPVHTGEDRKKLPVVQGVKKSFPRGRKGWNLGH